MCTLLNIDYFFKTINSKKKKTTFLKKQKQTLRWKGDKFNKLWFDVLAS